MSDAKIGIIMGSQSDWPTMKHAADILDELAVPMNAKSFRRTERQTACMSMPAPPKETG